jgi:hypothetical protein
MFVKKRLEQPHYFDYFLNYEDGYDYDYRYEYDRDNDDCGYENNHLYGDNNNYDYVKRLQLLLLQ